MMYYSILQLSHIKRVKSLALLLPTHKNAHIISLDTKSTIFSQCQTLCVEAKGYKTRALIVCVPYDRYSIFLYIFQSTYFHPVDENEGCLFSILLPFLEVGKILVYVFFFIFVCCFAFFTEYVIEWCIFVNDSGSPFSFLLSIHIRAARVTCVSVFDCPQSYLDLYLPTCVLLLLKGLFISDVFFAFYAHIGYVSM